MSRAAETMYGSQEKLVSSGSGPAFSKWTVEQCQEYDPKSGWAICRSIKPIQPNRDRTVETSQRAICSTEYDDTMENE